MRLILILGVIGILLLTSCTQSYLQEKTVEEIRKFKAEGKPVSELDKCLMEAKKDSEKYTLFIEECERNKTEILVPLGIQKYKQNLTDGCMENYEEFRRIYGDKEKMCEFIYENNAKEDIKLSASSHCYSSLFKSLENPNSNEYEDCQYQYKQEEKKKYISECLEINSFFDTRENYEKHCEEYLEQQEYVKTLLSVEESLIKWKIDSFCENESEQKFKDMIDPIDCIALVESFK